MGNLLGHAIFIKSGSAIRADDEDKLQETNKFKMLFDDEWNNGLILFSNERKLRMTWLFHLPRASPNSPPNSPKFQFPPQYQMPISDSGLDEISPALRRTNITFLVISGVATISMAI